MMSTEQSDTPSLSDLIRDCQYQTNNFHFSQLLDDFTSEWTSTTTDTVSENLNNIKTDQIKEDEEEEHYEEDSNDSLSSVQEQLPVSLFKTTQRRPWPWQRNYNISTYIFLLSL